MKYIVPLLWMRWKPDRKWVHRTPLTVILILEFGILTTLFGLTGYAEPNTYRDNLRQDGALSGFNKFPGVNGYTESLPPQVYRLSTTMFALYWTLTSFFMLVLKVVLRLLSYLPPSWAAAQAIVFAVVWIFDAILLQAGASAPSDDRPWWVTRSCERAYYRQNQHYCVQSKAILGLTVCVIVLYLTTAGLAIWSMRKNRMSKGKEPEEAAAQVEEDDENIDPYLVTPRRSRAQSMVGPPQPTPNRQTFQLEGREDTSLVGKMKRAKDEIIADIM